MSYRRQPSSPPKGKERVEDAFRAFMRKGWAARKTTSTKAIAGAENYRARRQLLADRLPKQHLVIPSGARKARTQATNFPFRASSDFSWLTGCQEPDAVLVLEARRKGLVSRLFVTPSQGKESDAFFTDRESGELWVGPTPSIAERKKRYGVDSVHPLAELPNWLFRHKVELLPGVDPRLEKFVRSKKKHSPLAMALAELRLLKDPTEIAELRSAIAVTKRALGDVLRHLRPGVSERTLEAVFSQRARAEGNWVGYEPIVASGANACVLHWNRNDGTVAQGDMLLVDAGVEVASLYTADITRTFPVDEVFSDRQRAIYDIVDSAKAAAIAAVRPGADFLAPHRAASAVLAQGLLDLKMLKGSLEAVLKSGHYRRYTLHGTSHMLGLDVHDSNAYPYRQKRLTPGMVLTIEPGLYIQPDDLLAPRALRGLGVRLEDNVLVTEENHENLSAEIPSDALNVERWAASERASAQE